MRLLQILRISLAFTKFEINRILESKKKFIFLSMIVISLLLGVIGINEYKESCKRKESFEIKEREIVSQYAYYRQYGTYGYRTLFVNPPISAFFFDSCVVPDIDAFVDAGSRLYVYPLKGKNVFDNQNTIFADPAGTIFLLGSLIAMLYGFDSLNNEKYLKFLSSLSTLKSTFFFVLFARMSVLFLLLFINIGNHFILRIILGVIIPIDFKFFIYSGFAYLLIVLFFVGGCYFSTMKTKGTGLGLMLTIWFILLFIIPLSVDSIKKTNASAIAPVYKLDLKKRKKLLSFEKRAREKNGVLHINKKAGDKDRNMIKMFMNDELKSIHELEEEIEIQMNHCVSSHHLLSAFFPSTFYLSLCNEVSGRGYNSMIEFHKHVQNNQILFTKFILNKVYFSKFSDEIEQFPKSDKNVFYSNASLPRSSLLGWGINIFYLIALITMTYFRYKRRYCLIECNHNPNMNSVIFNNGEFKEWVVEGDFLGKLIYNLLSGEDYKKWLKCSSNFPDVIINGTTVLNAFHSDFMYLSHPREFPSDITPNGIMKIIIECSGKKIRDAALQDETDHLDDYKNKRINDLVESDFDDFIFKLININSKPIIVFDNISKGMHAGFAIRLKSRIDKIVCNGGTVLFLLSDDLFSLKNSDKKNLYFENKYWSRMISDLSHIWNENKEIDPKLLDTRSQV